MLSTLAFSFVVRNQADGQQWATWWWVCIGGLIVFIPTIFVLSGYWNPVRSWAAARAIESAEELSSVKTGAGAPSEQM